MIILIDRFKICLLHLMAANVPVVRLVGELPPTPLSNGKNSVKGNKNPF